VRQKLTYAGHVLRESGSRNAVLMREKIKDRTKKQKVKIRRLRSTQSSTPLG